MIQNPGRLVPRVFSSLALKKFFGALALVVFLAGCKSSIEIEYERGVEATAKKDYQAAVAHFKKVVQRAPNEELGVQAAHQVAALYYFEIKDFNIALRFYKHVVVNSNNKILQIEAQKKIADIVFNYAADYKQSILEYSRLLELKPSAQERRTYLMALAKSYFYLSNFFQAQVESEKLINKKNPNDPGNFEPLLLRAHIAIAEKNLERAVPIYEDLMKNFPEQSKKELIALNLAVCYEETKDYDKAIAMLTHAKEYYPTPDFLQLKIERLKVRKSFLPGAQGFRK